MDNPPPLPPSAYQTPATMAGPAAGYRPIGKARSPGIGLVLCIVTLGIYGIVFGYSIFEEMKRYRRQGMGGGQYLLFSLVPFLNLVSIIFPWLIPSYIGRMYQEDGKVPPVTGVSGCWIFIPFAGGFIWWWKVNNALNAFWVSKGAAPV